MQPLATSAFFAIALVSLCVVLHYETLVLLERLSRRLGRHRWTTLITVHCLLFAHVVEIWVCGLGYYLAETYLDLGQVVPLEELRQVMDDMRIAGVDFITVGQYLQPTARHHELDRFVPPEEFAKIEAMTRSKGFLAVSATPMTRSSFHADDGFAALQAARRDQTAERDLAHV